MTHLFQVRKGRMMIARTPVIVHGAALSLPTIKAYSVMAATVIDGKAYT